jgi:hypothetical protein
MFLVKNQFLFFISFYFFIIDRLKYKNEFKSYKFNGLQRLRYY